MNPRDKAKAVAFYKRFGAWAVITGASDGIGLEMARSAARRGLSVVLVARRGDRLRDLARELEQAWSVETRVIVLDLSDPEAALELDRQTREIDVGLFIAAAGFGTSGPFIGSDLQAELAMLDVNCRTVLQSLHMFAHRFATRGAGGIVLMSSLFAFQGVTRAANYAATKAYIQGLAEGLRAELAARGVSIIASAPGPVASGFAARANMRMGAALRPGDIADETLDSLGAATTVRPGWLSKLLELSFIGLPRRARTWILSRVMEGMTRHHSPGRI